MVNQGSPTQQRLHALFFIISTVTLFSIFILYRYFITDNDLPIIRLMAAFCLAVMVVSFLAAVFLMLKLYELISTPIELISKEHLSHDLTERLNKALPTNGIDVSANGEVPTTRVES